MVILPLLMSLRDIRDRLETAVVEVRYADERLAALWENCKAAKVREPRSLLSLDPGSIQPLGK